MVAKRKFVTTPDEAVPLAEIVLSYLSKHRWDCKIETPYSPTAPFTTVIHATKGTEPTWLIECQARPNYTVHVAALSSFLRAERAHACLSIATSPKSRVSLAMLASIKREGVGLLIVDSGQFDINHIAIAPSQVVHLEHRLALGKCKVQTKALFDDFNSGNRVGALRSMCELVEGLTGKLALKAQRKGLITQSVVAVQHFDFSTSINFLKSGGAIGEQLKLDLHSFRGARNLVDHPPISRAEKLSLDRQLGERMIMGARLVAELLSSARRI